MKLLVDGILEEADGILEEADDTDFLDPSSGWAVDRVSWMC